MNHRMFLISGLTISMSQYTNSEKAAVYPRYVSRISAQLTKALSGQAQKSATVIYIGTTGTRVASYSEYTHPTHFFDTPSP